jgi:hypothetical protein
MVAILPELAWPLAARLRTPAFNAAEAQGRICRRDFTKNMDGTQISGGRDATSRDRNHNIPALGHI